MNVDELKDFEAERIESKWKKSELVARVFVAKKQQTTGGGSRFFPVILVPSFFSASFSLR